MKRTLVSRILVVVTANVATDGRKPVVVQLAVDLACNGDGFCDRRVGLDVHLRPASNVSISLGPSVGDEDTGYELVDAVSDTTADAFYDTRYVFAHVLQQDVSMHTRFNVTFTPNLTFELFVQPFIATARYTRYQEYAAPRSLDRLVYGVDVVSINPGNPSRSIRDSITVDPDGGGPADSLTFEDPSFTLRSLRGNAVLRWEYRPGSTLFVVWTRNGFSEATRGGIDVGRDVGALFRGPAANIFLIKFTFWLGY
jgi:hypothetical protein